MRVGRDIEMPPIARAGVPSMLAVATVAAVLPWGLAPAGRLMLPLAVASFILVAVSRQPQSLSPLWVLACGIVFDAMTLGPLGLWTLAWLGAHAAGCGLRADGAGPVRRVAGNLAGLAGAAVLYWGLASIYQWSPAEWRPLATAVVGSGGLLAVAEGLFEWLVAARVPGRDLRLERGA